MVTALFAIYVIRNLRGHDSKKILPEQVAQTPVALIHPKKHHKAIAPTISAVKKPQVNKDTITDKPTLQKVVTPAQTTAATLQESDDSTYATTLHANITGIVYLHQEPDYIIQQ